MNYESLSLSEVVEKVIDNRGLTPKKLGGDWSDAGYRVLSAKNIKNQSLVQEDKIRTIDDSLYSRWMDDDVHRGDIILTSEAPCGETLFWDSDEKIVLGQRLFGIRVKREYDPYYLFLYMNTRRFQNELSSRMTGTTVQGIRQSELMKCRLSLPSYDVQVAVTKQIKPIDDLIRLNNSINDYLLKLLETLYLRIRTDYSTDYTLSDICIINTERNYMDELSVENYYSTENMLPEKSGVVTASTLPSDQKVIACQVGDVLVSNIRPYFKKIHYCDNISGCSSDVICFRAKKIEDSPFLYSVLYDDRFFEYVVAGSKGTKMPRGDKQQIMMYPIPVVPKNVLKQFNKIGRCVLSIVSTNNTINRDLMKTREIILTKLLSK